jgi:AcrR family transcriptional regulator
VAPRAYTQRRRAESAAATRGRIIEAAIAVYREHGYPGATLQRIAARADVSRGTILHHFGDGEGLLGAVLDGALASLDVPDGSVLAGVPDPAARARRFVAEMFGFYVRTSDWWRVFTGGTNELPSNPAFAAATSRYEAAVGAFMAAALGPMMSDRVATITARTLVAPSTFYPLLGAGLSVDEASEVVGDLLADLVTGRLAAGT